MLSVATWFLLGAAFLSYLFTLPPSVLWRDTPELVNVAFSLSIAHPAGFPTYSLLVKPLTFIPFGSIAFKVNLASALFAFLSTLLLVRTSGLLIAKVCPSATSLEVRLSSLFAALLFAIGPIVWHNAISAEVYTLHALFLVALIYLILRWQKEGDPRWLYLGALLYGLSAGNHATVALYLPGLVALYFAYRPNRDASEWIRAVFFFLLGLSVYLYLPVRSLANPPFDWGDPQTLGNFLYQVTDQKDFGPGGVLSEGNGGFPLSPIFNHIASASAQFSPVGLALALWGLWLGLKHQRGISLFFLWIVVSNHAFFWGWTSGDAFLPSYVVLAHFLAIGTCALIVAAKRWNEQSSPRLRELVTVGLAAVVVLQLSLGLLKLDRRGYYLPSDFFRSGLISLDPRSLFLADVQWPQVKYQQDVERLREDVSLVSLGEVNMPRAFHYITPDRHPGLVLPGSPQLPGNESRFIAELVAQNQAAGRPVFRELTEGLNESLPFPIVPHRDFIFRLSTVPSQGPQPRLASYLRQMERRLLRIRAAQEASFDPDLHTYLNLYITTLAQYLDNEKHHSETVALLRLYLGLYGPKGKGAIDDKSLSVLYNALGIAELHAGETRSGLLSLERAIRRNPQNDQPYLVLTLWFLEEDPYQLETVFDLARKNGLRPKMLCDALNRHLLKTGEVGLLKTAQVYCERAA